MIRLYFALAALAGTVLADGGPAMPSGQISGGPGPSVPEPGVVALAAVAVGYMLYRRRTRD